MEAYLWTGLWCVIGVLIGIIIGSSMIKKYDGTLWIDQSDEEVDRYNLEFLTDLNEVPNKRFVIFKINKVIPRKNSSL